MITEKMITEKMVTEEIQSISIATFLDDLSSKNATPGGGAVAAITGAQAAALISMVCAFSVENPELESIARQAEEARVKFLKLHSCQDGKTSC